MNEIYKQLEKLTKKLQETHTIKLAKSDFRYYSESVNKSLVSDLKGITIAPSIMRHYEQIDFINIRWYVSENASIDYLDKEIDAVEGSVNIFPFPSFIKHINSGQSQSIIDPYKALSKRDYDSLIYYIPFDFLNGNGAVCFKNKGGIINDELHLILLGDESFIKPINCNVYTYLNEGLKQFFFFNWQKAVFLGDQQSKAQIDFYLNQLGF